MGVANFLARSQGHLWRAGVGHVGGRPVFPICTDGAAQYTPVVSGNYVAWVDERNGDQDIYGYNLSTDTEFGICTNAAAQEQPDISDGFVVWVDRRTGSRDIYGRYISQVRNDECVDAIAVSLNVPYTGDTYDAEGNGCEQLYDERPYRRLAQVLRRRSPAVTRCRWRRVVLIRRWRFMVIVWGRSRVATMIISVRVRVFCWTCGGWQTCYIRVAGWNGHVWGVCFDGFFGGGCESGL